MTTLNVSRTLSKAVLFQAIVMRGSVASVMFDPSHPDAVLHASLRKRVQTEGVGPAVPALVFQYGLHMANPIPEIRIDEHGIHAELSVKGMKEPTFVPWAAVFALISEEDGAIQVDDPPAHCAVAGAPQKEPETIRHDSSRPSWPTKGGAA